MRPIFRCFCINWFGIGPLQYISSRSDFGFEFAEIFVIEKRLADSASWGVADSLTRRDGESAIECLKENSPLRWVGESSTPRIAESKRRRLPNSASRWVGESSALRIVGESPSPQLAESRSRYGESGSRYSNFFKFIIGLKNQPFKGPI